MKFFIAFFIWLTFSTSDSNYHEFYLSVTDINYIEEEKSLQIISRVFTDDFEDVLNKRYNKNFKLIPKFEVEEIDHYIEKYIKSKFILKTNNTELNLNYLGRKYVDDMVYLFIEVENVQNFQSLTVENSILIDLYSTQKNMIHFKSADFKKSFILEKDITKKSINYTPNN